MIDKVFLIHLGFELAGIAGTVYGVLRAELHYLHKGIKDVRHLADRAHERIDHLWERNK